MLHLPVAMSFKKTRNRIKHPEYAVFCYKCRMLTIKCSNRRHMNSITPPWIHLSCVTYKRNKERNEKFMVMIFHSCAFWKEGLIQKENKFGVELNLLNFKTRNNFLCFPDGLSTKVVFCIATKTYPEYANGKSSNFHIVTCSLR